MHCGQQHFRRATLPAGFSHEWLRSQEHSAALTSSHRCVLGLLYEEVCADQQISRSVICSGK